MCLGGTVSLDSGFFSHLFLTTLVFFVQFVWCLQLSGEHMPFYPSERVFLPAKLTMECCIICLCSCTHLWCRFNGKQKVHMSEYRCNKVSKHSKSFFYFMDYFQRTYPCLAVSLFLFCCKYLVRNKYLLVIKGEEDCWK